MPRSKPDQVVSHRLELGTFERDLIYPLTLATNVAMWSVVGAAAIAAALGMAAAAHYGWQTEGVREVIFGPDEIPDASGGRIPNPAAGIPLIGGLFGLGMKIGRATSPFD